MKTRSLRPLLAALALVLAGAACSGDQPRDPDGTARPQASPRDPEELNLQAALEAMTRAVETENSFEFMERVSDRYSPSPLVLKTAVDAMLMDYLGYTFHLRTTHFHREDDEALLLVEWRFGRSHRQTGAISWESGQAELRFRRESGAWKLLAQTGDLLFEAPPPS